MRVPPRLISVSDNFRSSAGLRDSKALLSKRERILLLTGVSGTSISKLLVRESGSGTSFKVSNRIQLLPLDVIESEAGEKGRSSSRVRWIDGIS